MKITKFILVFVFIFLYSGNLFGQESAKEAETLFMAKKAYEDGFYEVSLGMLERFKNNFPYSTKAAEVRLLTGQCYFFQNRYSEALDIFESLLKEPLAGNFRDAIYFWIAEVHFKGNNFDKAAAFYELVIKEFPQSSYIPQAYYSLGWSFSQMTKYAQALKSFQFLQDKFPTEPQSKDAAFKIIECLYNLKKYAELKTKINPYFKLFADDTLRLPYLYFYLAESEYYLNNLEASSGNYLKSAQVAKDDKVRALSKLGLAWSYLKLKKYKEAEDTFGDIKQSDLDKKSIAILLLGQGLLMSQNNRVYESKEIYEQLISLSSDPLVLLQAYLGKADALYNLAEYAEAVKIYKEGLDKIDKNSLPLELLDKLRYNLGLAYIKEGQLSLAIDELTSVASNSKDTEIKVSALLKIGDAYQDSSEFAKAEGVYANILKDYPNSSYCDYAQYQLGLAQLNKADLAQAVASFKLMLKKYAQSKLLDNAVYALGLAYFQKQDYISSSEMFARFQSEFKQSPLCAQAFYMLGTCFLNLNKFDEALKIFKDIPKLYPQDSELLQKTEYEIADCYYKLGQEKEAISRFKLLRAKYPNAKLTPQILWWLGQYYYKQEELDLARRYFSSLIKDFSNDPLMGDCFYALALISSNQDKLYDAIDNLKMAIKIGNNEIKVKAVMALDDLYSEIGKPEEAIKEYNAMLKNHPDMAALVFPRLANCYFRAQDYEQAKLFYQLSLNTANLNIEQAAYLQFNLAEVLEAKGEIDAALAQYLLLAEPNFDSQGLSLRALLRVAKIYEDKENLKEALKIYQIIMEKKTEESGFAKERAEWITAQGIR